MKMMKKRGEEEEEENRISVDGFKINGERLN
jgi:hypothetical protein